MHRYFIPDLLRRVLVHHSRPAPPYPTSHCLCGAISERLRLESFCSGLQMFPMARSHGPLPCTSNVSYSSPKTNVTVLAQSILPPRPASLDPGS